MLRGSASRIRLHQGIVVSRPTSCHIVPPASGADLPLEVVPRQEGVRVRLRRPRTRALLGRPLRSRLQGSSHRTTPTACKRDLLDKHDLSLFAISNPPQSARRPATTLSDARHWGSRSSPPSTGDNWQAGRGQPVGRRGDERTHRYPLFRETASASSTASPAAASARSALPTPKKFFDDGYRRFAGRWNPILDVLKSADSASPSKSIRPRSPSISTRQQGLESDRPQGVRLQRVRPPDLAGGRLRRVHPRVPGPDLPRP